MTQQLTVKKSAKSPANDLWWKPFFSIQQEFNNSMQDILKGLYQQSMPSEIWHIEDTLFQSAQRNTHRIFSELFNNRQLATPWITGDITEPYVDIIENEEEFKIRADVPGIQPEDLDIIMSDSAVVINGIRCEESKEKDEEYIRRECHCGAFSRTIALPKEADTEKTSATFDKNVLMIKVPKKKELNKSRKIAVEHSKPVESKKKSAQAA